VSLSAAALKDTNAADERLGIQSMTKPPLTAPARFARASRSPTFFAFRGFFFIARLLLA